MASHSSPLSRNPTALTEGYVADDHEMFEPASWTASGRVRTQPNSGYKVLILSGDSDYNLGDTAILTSICHCLHSIDKRVKITVTSREQGWAKVPGIKRVIERRPGGIVDLIRSARHQDLIIVGGGGLLQDDDSRLKMPYWSSLIRSLRLLNKNIVGHSIGAGPLNHWESRKLAAVTCAGLKSLSVRDHFAQEWLMRCVGQPVEVVPDPSFMLLPAPPATGAAFIRALGLKPDRPIIGVALRRWFHPLGGFIPHKMRVRTGLDRGEGRLRMNYLLEQLASSLRQLAEEMNAAILLLPTYNVHHESDITFCRQLATHLPQLTVRIGTTNNPHLYKSVVGHLKLMIAARMHPLIFAASMNVPIVGLAYNGKFDGLFELLGIPKRLLWMNDFQKNDMRERLTSLAFDALGDKTDIQHRSALLGKISFERTSELVQSMETERLTINAS